MTYTPQHRLRFSQEALRTYPRPLDETETGSLLVGIDATGDDRGVLSIAGALARREGRHVHLVGVASDAWRPAGWPSNADEGDLRDYLRSQLQDRTRRRLQRILGLNAYWSVDAAFGSLASVLVDESRRQRPALILLGADRVGSAARAARAHQALHIARATDIPVLVIPPDRERVPSRVIVATDLSSASRHAALTSLRLPGRRAEVTIAHVEPAIDLAALGHAALADRNAEGLAPLLEDFARELRGVARERLTSGCTPHCLIEVAEPVRLRGEPAPEILELAARHDADLIVAGTRSRTALGPAPHDSVTRDLLVGAPCSVLIVHS